MMAHGYENLQSTSDTIMTNSDPSTSTSISTSTSTNTNTGSSTITLFSSATITTSILPSSPLSKAEYESIRVAILSKLQQSDKEDDIRLHPTMVRLSMTIFFLCLKCIKY